MAVAVVRDAEAVLASVVHSQDAVHAPYGGVVPELASRDHVRHLHATLCAALERAGVGLDAIDAIGVTSGPGLIGSLLVGFAFAKALAYRTGKPLLAVHHIEGHLASCQLDAAPLPLPLVGLVVSGLARIRLLGQTRDDAAGEAFDKVAKRLGLGYPGGREIDLHARKGNGRAFAFPRPLLGGGFELSFSGLKTAVAHAIDAAEARCPDGLPPELVNDLAASFQEAAVDVLVEKARRALAETGIPRLAVVGGLAANSRLRERMAELAVATGSEIRFPPLRLCTDNAAMIAAVADRMLAEGQIAPLGIEAFSRVPLAAQEGPPGPGGTP